jgi:hypothetical protein
MPFGSGAEAERHVRGNPDSGHAGTISITIRACRTGGTP